MPKENIHPKWFDETKVDIWSGNHPFYTGSQRIIDTEGRVERFLKKYKIEETSS